MTTNDKETVGSFLKSATAGLTKSGIPTARLDTLILMEDILGLNRANILAHPEQELAPSQRQELASLIEKRREHIPLAYLRGTVMFYGRSFLVTTDTLVPRPESEDMITLLKTWLSDVQCPSVADIGTGTGCLGLTAMLGIPNSTADLYDISSDALAVAKKNAEKHGLLLSHYYKEDLLSKASDRKYDALLANLPYVPEDYEVNSDALFEPKLALFSGKDGLDDYRSFWQQTTNFKLKPRFVLTESIPDIQHDELQALAKVAGYVLKEVSGFIQLFAVT